MNRGPKRYTLRRFPHWRLIVGASAAWLAFGASLWWLVARVAGWTR